MQAGASRGLGIAWPGARGRVPISADSEGGLTHPGRPNGPPDVEVACLIQRWHLSVLEPRAGSRRILRKKFMTAACVEESVKHGWHGCTCPLPPLTPTPSSMTQWCFTSATPSLCVQEGCPCRQERGHQAEDAAIVWVCLGGYVVVGRGLSLLLCALPTCFTLPGLQERALATLAASSSQPSTRTPRVQLAHPSAKSGGFALCPFQARSLSIHLPLRRKAPVLIP